MYIDRVGTYIFGRFVSSVALRNAGASLGTANLLFDFTSIRPTATSREHVGLDGSCLSSSSKHGITALITVGWFIGNKINWTVRLL